MATALPGQVAGEAHTQVEQGPGAHHHVVDIHIEPHKEHTVAKTLNINISDQTRGEPDNLECRDHPSKHLVSPNSGILPHGQLHEEGRKTNQE